MSDTDTPWRGRAILHVDIDAFFAAVEQLDHPEWRGKPVIIGSPKGRGVVSTASYEARVYGVRSAMPSVRAAQLCPDAVWAPPRFARYTEISRQVFAILRSFSPAVQPVSVDEAYLDVTPGRDRASSPRSVAEEISRRVDELGITCSIGVATSKTVAKIASDADKPHGITIVEPGDEAAFLAPLAVGVLPGIGPKTAERLVSVGVRTLGELARLDVQTARDLMGSHGPETLRRASGIDSRQVRENDPRKSLSAESTYPEDVRDEQEVRRAMESLAARVGRRLRKAEHAGRTVTVKVRFSDFSTRTVRHTLDSAIDSDDRILEVASELLREVWHPGVGVRLLGIGLSGFDQRSRQLDLAFAEEQQGQEARASRIQTGIDTIRERFGDDAVRKGAKDIGPKRPVD